MGYFHKNVLPESRLLSLPYGVSVSRSSKVATQSISADLLGILEEIFSYGIGGLYARHGRGYNVFVHEPFFDRFFLTGQF